MNVTYKKKKILSMDCDKESLNFYFQNQCSSVMGNGKTFP